MKLIVIGSSNMDLVIYVPRIPAIGETILGGKSAMVFGGKGANQAVSAIRAGGSTAFISKVGNDLFGSDMKAHYEKEKLPIQYILTDEKEATGVAQIFVSEKGENSIAVASGANMNLTVDDIQPLEKLIIEAEIILLQLEIPLATVSYLIDLAAQHQTKVILNPAPAQALSDQLLSKVWILSPNESETKLLTNMDVTDVDSAKKAGAVLLNKGLQNVIITLGENGCLLCNESGFQHFSAFKEDAIDTTAAGDVFNGSLAVALTENKSFEEAIRFASAAAAISVTRKGAQPSAPSKEEIIQYLIKNN